MMKIKEIKKNNHHILQANDTMVALVCLGLFDWCNIGVIKKCTKVK